MIVRIEIEMDQGANAVRVEREVPDPEAVSIERADGERIVSQYNFDPTGMVRHLATIAMEAMG